jgi:small subunit ribosomal protein S16
MLTIRMQRLGRKGHPTYRVVVQDVRQTPTSGKYVALLGSYDPHAKTTTLDREKAEFYLANGAQPSDRVVRLLNSEGVKLPDWVKLPTEHKREIRNADKLRKNRPAEETPAEEPAAEEVSEEKPAEEPAAEVADDAKEAPVETSEDTPEEAPAKEAKS